MSLLIAINFPLSIQITEPIHYPNNSLVNYYTVDSYLTFNINFQNPSPNPVTNLSVWIGCINNWTYGSSSSFIQQRSYIISMTPQPNNTFTGLNDANNKIFYYTTVIPPASSFSIEIKYRISSRDIKWLFNPYNIKDYNTSSEIYTNYTAPEVKIESNNTDIINLAANIVSGISNPYYKVRAIYNWVTSNLVYSPQTEERGALWALNNREGDCSEFSDLFIALCRAEGIPSRKVTGWAFAELANSIMPGVYNFTDYPGHAWVEVYFEDYGWVVYDPTWGNTGYYYMETVDPFHITTVKGQNVTIEGKEFIEFSSVYYQWVGPEGLTDIIRINLEVQGINYPVIEYDIQTFIIIIAVPTLIISVSGYLYNRKKRSI
ncbi:MAG: transglutaminase-like domain-containing protein [Candidatus Odinarchaeia archaeon]